MHATFGIVAGILQVVAAVPYLRDVLRGTTTPQRATWTIWTSLGVVVLASQWASGATWSLALTIGQALSCAIIFLLALRRGEGGLSPLEVLLLGIAGLGIVGWQVADDPVIATCAVIGADLIGFAMMLPKVYRRPRSETLSTFVIGTVSSVLALLALESLEAGLLIYPLYILIADGVLVALLVSRRRALALAT
jgi:hypothetical protein